MILEHLDPIEGSETTLRDVGGRVLRVAHWKASRKTKHPPILFFNGIGANIELVAPFARRFGDRDFVMFDMPGIGGSPDPVMPYNAFTMSRTAARLLDQMGIEQVDVMGVSWGGAMAQHFAMQHARLTRRLVLAATSAGMLMVPGKVSALSKMADPRRYIDPAFMARNFQTLYGGSLDGSVGHMSRIKPPSGLGYLYQLLALAGWTSAPALPFLMKAQTLIMMGSDDNIVPVVNGRILQSLIPNSRLHIVEGGGHLFMVAEAEETTRVITAFLDEREPATKPVPA